MSGLDRRAFLKCAALTSAAGLVPEAGQAEQAGQAAARRVAADWHAAPCQLCGVGCGLLVAVEGGRAAAVRGNPESPAGQGLACARGYHAVQALYGRDRLTRAMVRRNGALVPVGLETALDAVARGLGEALSAGGPGAAGVFGGPLWTIPDAYLASKFFLGALGSGHVESCDRLAIGSARAGLLATYGLDGIPGCHEDFDHADVFVLWNVNLAETDPVLFSRMLARKRGQPAVRIVDLATRITRSSYPSDETQPYAPHSEIALANAIAHELVARRWVRRDFLDRHVSVWRGPAALATEIPDGALASEAGTAGSWEDLVAFLAEYTPDNVARVTGVPADRIRWLASLYGDRTRRVVSVWGANLNGAVHGTWANTAVHNLHLLTGRVGTPGNGAYGASGLTSVAGLGDGAGASAGLLPGGRLASADDRRRAAAVWNIPEARLAGASAHHALGMFRALERGDLRFLWLQGANPMVALPNLDRYRRALRQDRPFVVASDAYPTPTTDVADVVLPAALWVEREGIVATMERRLHYWSALVRPPGEAHSDSWLTIEVARRLGHGALFPWGQATHVTGSWEEYRRFHVTPASALPAVEDLRRRPGHLWPASAGREVRWRYATAHDPAADRARGTHDFYGHPDHRARLWLRPQAAAPERPDAQYPFWLATAEVLEHADTGTLTQRIPTLHRSLPQAYLEIHREDARALGVRHGERVRLVTRRGSLELPARIDYRAQPPRGQLVVPVFDEGLPIQRLMPETGCPVSGQPTAGACAARVERVGTRQG